MVNNVFDFVNSIFFKAISEENASIAPNISFGLYFKTRLNYENMSAKTAVGYWEGKPTCKASGIFQNK